MHSLIFADELIHLSDVKEDPIEEEIIFQKTSGTHFMQTYECIKFGWYSLQIGFTLCHEIALDSCVGCGLNSCVVPDINQTHNKIWVISTIPLKFKMFGQSHYNVISKWKQRKKTLVDSVVYEYVFWDIFWYIIWTMF